VDGCWFKILKWATRGNTVTAAHVRKNYLPPKFHRVLQHRLLLQLELDRHQPLVNCLLASIPATVEENRQGGANRYRKMVTR
jgi:hypothetical protein